MAILAQKANLMAHVAIVASTPFNFFFAVAWIRRTRLILMLIVACLLYFSGLVDIDLPRWADIKEDVGIFSAMVVVLWVLSGMLTLVDHFRFDGWIDDGPTGAVQFASSYCDSVIEGNNILAAEMSASFLTRNEAEFIARLQSIRCELGDARNQATAESLGTVDHVLFRALVPNLQHLEAAPTDIVAFVPVVPDSNVPVGSPIKIIQLLIASPFGKFEVADCKIVETPRPQILT